MESTVACVAVGPTKIAVVYDSSYNLYSNPNDFKLLPHSELIAVDQASFTFLKNLNYTITKTLDRNYLRYPCKECNDKKCLITIALLGWRSHMKRKGISLKHGNKIPTTLSSPRSQIICIALEFDELDNLIDGCAVADNGYLDGNPMEWLPNLLKSNTVLVAKGSKTYKWLNNEAGYPIKEERDYGLKYPCKECGKKSCVLVKAYYGWRKQALQVNTIPH